MPIGPTLSIALNNLPATVARGGSVQFTDVTTNSCPPPPNGVASNPTTMDYFIQATNTQPPTSGFFGYRNVNGLAGGQSYTRPAGSAALVIPTTATAGANFFVARLRAYPTVFTAVAITIT